MNTTFLTPHRQKAMILKRIIPANFLRPRQAELKLTLRLLGLSLMLVTLTACTINKAKDAELVRVYEETTSTSIQFHTTQLANQLFDTFRYGNLPKEQFRFAVATFVPVEMLKTDSTQQGPLRLLGHQLEQGMMTELARRGYWAQDYKTTNNLIIEEKSDRVFSRDVDNLVKHHYDVDFYLSGTLTESEQGVVANARIIRVDSKDVVAAATHFIPDRVFWETEQVTTRGGMIYRSSGE